jgi:beta-galactosidase
MKRLLLFLAILLLPILLFSAESPRQQLNFNREWKFQLGDQPGAEATGYNDSKWDDIGLPHSFSIPYFESPKLLLRRL